MKNNETPIPYSLDCEKSVSIIDARKKSHNEKNNFINYSTFEDINFFRNCFKKDFKQIEKIYIRPKINPFTLVYKATNAFKKYAIKIRILDPNSVIYYQRALKLQNELCNSSNEIYRDFTLKIYDSVVFNFDNGKNQNLQCVILKSTDFGVEAKRLKEKVSEIIST